MNNEACRKIGCCAIISPIMSGGRPSEFNPEIASRLLAAIATTNQSLQTICNSDPEFPNPSTIFYWMMRNEEFSKQYARAKEEQTQVLEDEMLALADNTQPGEVVTHKADGSVERKVSDMIEHRKLQIETRKWLMGKLKPKKYGDKMVHSGDPEAPLQIISTIPRPPKE